MAEDSLFPVFPRPESIHILLFVPLSDYLGQKLCVLFTMLCAYTFALLLPNVNPEIGAKDFLREFLESRSRLLFLFVESSDASSSLSLSRFAFEVHHIVSVALQLVCVCI